MTANEYRVLKDIVITVRAPGLVMHFSLNHPQVELLLGFVKGLMPVEDWSI